MRTIICSFVALLVSIAAPGAAGTNGWLAYEYHPKKSDTCRDIAVSSPKGGRFRVIVGTDNCEMDPRFSPSGRRIGWVTEFPEGDRLIVAHRGGQSSGSVTEEIVTGDGGWGWSNTDHRLVYVRPATDPLTEEPDLWITDALGRDHERVTTTPSRAEGLPSWSPDGSRIAFVADGELLTIKPDGTDEAQLTDGAEITGNGWDAHSYPVWSPDSTMIAFASVRDDPWDPPEYEGPYTSEIYVVPSGGGEPTNVSNLETTEDVEPRWLDNKRLVFVAGYHPDNCESDCDADIYKVRSDGSKRKVLLSGRAHEWSPVISPNGRWVAFNKSAAKGRYSGAYKVQTDGSRLKKLRGIKRGWPDVDHWAPRYN